jgi:fructan beta-fructosidase
VDFSSKFPAPMTAPMVSDHPLTTLQVFLDTSSVEIFINGGETVLTALEFPATPYTEIRVATDKPIELSSGDLYQLRSIWKDP